MTGEYPPNDGGVGAYSSLVARGLARRGDRVTVLTPNRFEPADDDAGVEAVALPDHFGPRSRALMNRRLREAPDARLLVQYVPQALGMRGMNLPLCIWLAMRRRAPIDVMFHEVAYPIQRGQPVRHNVFGVVTRVMAAIVARSASRVFVAIPAWETILRRYAPRHPSITWLPVPSNIPVADDPEGALNVRRRLMPGEGLLLGHFGTYGASIAGPLGAVVELILRRRGAMRVLLIGHGSREFLDGFARRNPELAARVTATGELAPQAVSLHLAACDLMIQPYPDGISTRRTSAMSSLAHGRAVVTTTGHLTEPLWRESGAVELAPAGDPECLTATVLRVARDAELRRAMSERARALYDERFDLRHTIAALRGSDASPRNVAVDVEDRAVGG